MRQLLYIITASFLFIFAPSTFAASSTNATGTTVVNSTLPSDEIALSHVNLLFVQTAQSAKLRPISGKPNYFTLTLYNVNPYITYFTDRPNRVTGVVPLANFIKAWAVGTNSFAEDNPNAVLTAAIANGSTNNSLIPVVIQLASPIYSLTQNTLTFTVNPIGNTQFIIPQMDYDYVTLVIGVAGNN